MNFGTSGLRGLVADMTDQACEAWTRAFLTYLAESGAAADTLLVGRDLRPSSPRIAAACRRAAVAAGCRVIDCGALPTPALALESLRRGAPAAMVTGSHIPFDRNGVKFYRADGEITKDDEAGVLAARDAPAPDRSGGVEEVETNACTRYVNRALSAFDAGFLAGRRIGVHQHSAVGRDLLVDALSRAGAEVIALDRADSFVPIDTEAVDPDHAARMRAWAQTYALDAIVSTDGDGDRPLVADEAGVMVRGDTLGVLAARRLGADAIATPVSSTTAVERCGWFPAVRRTRIGSPHVIAAMAAMAAEGARLPVAFEANGGFLIGSDAVAPSGATLTALPTRDALLPMLTVLAMAGDAPLSAVRNLLPPRFTESDRLKETPPELTAPLLASLAKDTEDRTAFCAAISRPPPQHLDLTDGVRMIFPDERILHLRRSGNAPELRAYAEAEDAAIALDLTRSGLAEVRRRLEAMASA